MVVDNGKPSLVFDNLEAYQAFAMAQNAKAVEAAQAAQAAQADAGGGQVAAAAAARRGRGSSSSSSSSSASAAAAGDEDDDAGQEVPPPATRPHVRVPKREGPHPDAGAVRGIYAAEDEADPEFREVQTFETKTGCKEWYAFHRRRTNPDYESGDHIYTTACDWGQVCRLLLRPLAALRARFPARVPRPLPAGNRFAASRPVLVGLRSRLRLPVHEAATDESTTNTLRYLFFHMRCGIFVAIRAGAVRMFVPFVNKDYSNNWGADFRLEGSMSVDEYYRAKRARTKIREKPIPDRRRWWANGNIMCNVEPKNFWGDSYLTQLRHMFERVCAEREVADCEFFINKRDFPHLKKDQSEPYDFLFPRDGVPLDREAWSSLAPVCSFFLSHEFADLPLVTTDDWETATGVVFAPAGNDLRSRRNRKRHDVPWAERRSTAIFRGNSTGPGTTPETNQRLALARLSAQWRTDDRYGEGNGVDGVAFLDAGVVGWNFRDRKLQGRPMTFIKTETLGFDTVERVPMYKQAEFKYQVYVDGHCAAMRYASMMPLGSLILRVASVTKADHMWYFPLLKAHDRARGDEVGEADHLVVAADLSDLAEVIEWCKRHDVACERIVSNSVALYKRLISREGLLDYTQLMLREVALRFRSHASLAAELGAPQAAAPPDDQPPASSTSSSSSSSSSSTSSDPPADPEAADTTWCPAPEPQIEMGLPDPQDPLGDGLGVWADRGYDWFGADNAAYASCRVAAAASPRPTLEDRVVKKRKPKAQARQAAGGAPAAPTIDRRAIERRKAAILQGIKGRLQSRGGGSVSKGLAAVSKAAAQGSRTAKRPRDP